jgi:hypothetical protein
MAVRVPLPFFVLAFQRHVLAAVTRRHRSGAG